MKFTTLTNRFSRSEGGDNGANKRDSTVPYSPAPYSSPVQGPGSLLLPAHPALLEACQLALEPKPIPQDPEHQEQEQQEHQKQEQQDPFEQEPRLNLGITPTACTSARPRRSLPRDATNWDLRLALGTYLDYMPLVGEDGEEEECQSSQSINKMDLNQGCFGLRPRGTTPSLPPLHRPQAFPPRPTESDRGSLAKSEEVLTGFGIEEVHPSTVKRVRSYSKQAFTGSEISTTTATEDETLTPSIPLRNPARLLRGNVPDEMVSAVSFRWQRRHNKRVQLAAGSNSRLSTRGSSPMVASQTVIPTNSSETTDRVRDNVQGEVQIINKANDGGDDKNEGDGSAKDNSIGLGIRIENQPSHVRSSNRTDEIKPNTNEALENGGGAGMGHIHAEGRGWGASAGDVEDGVNKPSEVKANNAPKSDIGLGINVYGLYEPFGYIDDEDGQLGVNGDKEFNVLLRVLLAAWKAEAATRPVPALDSLIGTGPNETATAVEAREGDLAPKAPELTGAIRYIKAADGIIVPRSLISRTVAAERVVATEQELSENVVDAVITATEVEVTEAAALAGSVLPTPPLSVAVFRDVAPLSTSSSHANAAKPPSIQTEQVNNEDFIDELLEANYRGQADSFNRKISGTSAVRSFSTHSGASTTSLRATSQSFTTYTPSRFAEGLVQRVRSLRTPSAVNKVVIQPFAICHGGETRNRSGVSSSKQGPPPSSPHITYGHRFYTVPEDSQQLSAPKTRPRPVNLPKPSHRGVLYFTEGEREYINRLVHAEPRGCEKHPNCTECYNTEYAYVENKVMSTSIPPEERNRIISNNRSLRTIKNELEALAETGAISDEQFDTVMNALPSESPLSGASRSSQAAAPAPPTAALNDLNLGNVSSPPSYTTAAPPPPSLPARNPPSKPEIARATALYRYAEPGDCNFEVGDEISVYEYMNADWWLGMNLRTGQEGVFPVNYVQPQANPTQPSRSGPNAAPAHNPYYGNEKGNNTYGGGYPPQQHQYHGAPQSGPSNQYNNAAPPMQVAEESGEGKTGKGGEMGKKFGKKLGNAAIFGAGATMGSELVHSIF